MEDGREVRSLVDLVFGTPLGYYNGSEVGCDVVSKQDILDRKALGTPLGVDDEITEGSLVGELLG
jgi:hypothetical protein